MMKKKKKKRKEKKRKEEKPFNILIVGSRAQIIYWALGLVRESGWFEEEQMVKNDLDSGLNEQNMNGKVVQGGISPWI